MNPREEKERSIAENETFVRLIQAAQDDPKFREKLIAILSLDSFNRKSVLNAFIENMQRDSVTEDLIAAMADLLDDEVAELALKVIEKSH